MTPSEQEILRALGGSISFKSDREGVRGNSLMVQEHGGDGLHSMLSAMCRGGAVKQFPNRNRCEAGLSLVIEQLYHYG